MTSTKREFIELPVTALVRYSGVCHMCHQALHSFLFSSHREDPSAFRLIGHVPPPVIVVACQCQIPVTSVELLYQGACE